ncbi:unnamed protein product [Camellia sinensis]
MCLLCSRDKVQLTQLLNDVARRFLTIFVAVIPNQIYTRIVAFFLRPDQDSKICRYWNWYHHWVGRIALLFGNVNIIVGIQIGDAGSGWKAGYGFLLGTVLIATIVLEILSRIKRSEHTDVRPASAMELALSLEKLTNEKLLSLHGSLGLETRTTHTCSVLDNKWLLKTMILKNDLKGRLLCYKQDWTGGFRAGFRILPPIISFGEQLDRNTETRFGSQTVSSMDWMGVRVDCNVAVLTGYLRSLLHYQQIYSKHLCKDVAAVDINMGCPKSFSISGGMGAALLTKLALIHDVSLQGNRLAGKIPEVIGLMQALAVLEHGLFAIFILDARNMDGMAWTAISAFSMGSFLNKARKLSHDLDKEATKKAQEEASEHVRCLEEDLGKLRYKFFVDGEWRHDEHQPFVSGNYGVVNSVFLKLGSLMGRSSMDVDNDPFFHFLEANYLTKAFVIQVGLVDKNKAVCDLWLVLIFVAIGLLIF